MRIRGCGIFCGCLGTPTPDDDAGLKKTRDLVTEKTPLLKNRHQVPRREMSFTFLHPDTRKRICVIVQISKDESMLAFLAKKSEMITIAIGRGLLWGSTPNRCPLDLTG